MIRWLTITGCILPSVALAGGDAFFEPGQRWICVTEQGAEAFMSIANVEGTAVSFSYGVLNADTQELDPLCNKRDALDYNEMLEFCTILGSEDSEGHARLIDDCAAEGME